jgi:hypothetical protein
LGLMGTSSRDQGPEWGLWHSFQFEEEVEREGRVGAGEPDSPFLLVRWRRAGQGREWRRRRGRH